MIKPWKKKFKMAGNHFQQLYFDGLILPLFIKWCYSSAITLMANPNLNVGKNSKNRYQRLILKMTGVSFNETLKFMLLE